MDENYETYPTIQGIEVWYGTTYICEVETPEMAEIIIASLKANNVFPLKSE